MILKAKAFYITANQCKRTISNILGSKVNPVESSLVDRSSPMPAWIHSPFLDWTAGLDYWTHGYTLEKIQV